MFSILRAAFTLLICLLAIGFYRGWFSFNQSVPDPQSNKVNVNVSVDKTKMGNDLQKLERNVAKRIEDINNQPQGNNPTPPSGRQPPTPGLSFGPITVQPSGQAVQPPGGQPWSVGPYSQPPSQPIPPPSGPPPGPPQTQDYQFTVPLAVPPPGEGR